MQKKKKIHVIGLNSFQFRDLGLDIQNLIGQTKNITAPISYIEDIKNWCSERFINDKNFFISKSDANLIKWLQSLDNDVIVFSRGDPLWYGIGRILIENLPEEELLFYPANTCVQLAFSRLKKPWQGVKTVSIHGRDSIELIKYLKLKEKSIAVLTDPKNKSLELIRRNLKELKLENYYEYWLLEDIGSDNEKIREISLMENLPSEISNLNIVILIKKEKNYTKNSLPLFGINDNYFKSFDDRPNLITKREVRIQILADLELPEKGTLFDIGSGTGTIGLEALRLRPKIKLICIDKRLGSKSLISENAKRLGVLPNKIIEGDVKQYFINNLKESFSELNRIVIGGCDKETKIFVIKYLTNYLKKDDIIVIPIVTYEVLQQLCLILKELNYQTNINLLQIFKGVSIVEGTRFEANNPVFIIKAKKK